MEHTGYLQRVKSLTFKEMGAEVIFVFFLLTLISHLYTSVFVNVTEGNLLFALAFLLLLGSLSLAVILVGWTVVGLILASFKKRWPKFLSLFLGLLTGIVLALILNKLFSPYYYADYLNDSDNPLLGFNSYGWDYLIVFLLHLLSADTLIVPSTFTTLMLGYVGWKINKIESLRASFSQVDFEHQGNLVKNTSYFERVKSMTLRGVKIGITPAVLSAIVFAFYDYINIVFVDTEFTLDSYTVFFITVFVVLSLLFLVVGAGVLSSVLAIWKTRLPTIVSGFLGLIIGVIVAIIVNRYLYINIFYGSDYDVIAYTHSYVDFITIFSPGILEILILIYVGWRINDIKISSTISQTKE